MITATKEWFKRNRTNLAIGAGVVGSLYLAGQYVLGKISEARQRMRDDAIATENIRQRFRQNQEDCTFTVLALLPTASDNVLKALPVEEVLGELQARKSEKLAAVRGAGLPSGASSEMAPSDFGTEDGGSVFGGTPSVTSGSFVHASQQLGASGNLEGQEERARPTEKRSGKSKVVLWEELKILSITRALTLIYTLPLLTLLTRIQLNLLGRRTYLSSVVTLASPPLHHRSQQTHGTDGNDAPAPIMLENNDDDRGDYNYYGADFDTNRKYLTFSWWLLHVGWATLRAEIEAAVSDVFGSLNPRDSLSFDRLAELILDVRRKVEGAEEEARREKRWLEYLLPPRGAEEERVLREASTSPSSSSYGNSRPGSPEEGRHNRETITASLRRLLDETSDLIDSPTFSHVLTLLLDSAFSVLVDDKVSKEAFKITPNRDFALDSRVVEITEAHDTSATAKLATILAVFTRQAHAIGRGGEESIAMIEQASIGLSGAGPMGGFGAGPAAAGIGAANEYLGAFESVKDLEAFAVVVYSSNFEFEGLNDEEDQEGSNTTASDIEQSLVDVGAAAESSLESAWDKAVTSQT